MSLEPTDPRTAGLPGPYAAARGVAGVASAFCAIVLVLLIANTIASRSSDPLLPLRLTDMQLQLNREPRNEQLRTGLRRLDTDVRRAYFRHRAFAGTGFVLLLGGVGVLLASLEIARRAKPDIAAPRPQAAQEYWMSAAVSRRSVVGLGAVLGGVLMTLAVLSRHDTAAEYARAAERPIPPQAAAVAIPSGATAASQAAPGAGMPQPAPAPNAAALPAQPVGGALSAAPGGTALVAEPIAVAPAPVAVTPAQPSAAAGAPAAGAAPATAATAAGRSGAPAAAAPYITRAAAAQWPGFRGPSGAGLAPATPWPTAWDAAAGKGVAWTAPIPLPGWGSPVVWGDRVLLSGASAARREVFCYAAASGKLLWRTPVPPAPGAAAIRVSDDTGYAPATMATDGLRACAAFPNGDVACVDLTGRLLWTRQLGAPENTYGHASCPIIYGGGLIVQMDQGSSAEDGKSLLMALDLKTGKTVWQVKRPVPNSWSTPLLVRAGNRDELITCANPWVIAYDPRSGAEFWRAECLGGEVAPSPTVGGGFVLTLNQTACLAAIRPGGTGAVTATAIAWKFQENLPDITSPVCANRLVFMVTSEGLLTCVDAATGKKVWEHDYEAPFRASLIAAGSRIYALDAKGTMHIVDAGRAFRELSRGSVGEEAHATPAFSAGRIFIRGKSRLFCIGGRP